MRILFIVLAILTLAAGLLLFKKGYALFVLQPDSLTVFQQNSWRHYFARSAAGFIVLAIVALAAACWDHSGFYTVCLLSTAFYSALFSLSLGKRIKGLYR